MKFSTDGQTWDQENVFNEAASEEIFLKKTAWPFFFVVLGLLFVAYSLENIQRPISSFDAALLGLVQGLTEYLPVSSSGHLILTMKGLGLDQNIFVARGLSLQKLADVLCVVFQGASALAVLFVLRGRVASLIPSHPLKWQSAWSVLLLGTLPAAVLGFFSKSFIQKNLFGLETVAWSVLIGGLFMGLVAIWQSQQESFNEGYFWQNLTWKHASFIGIMQCLALCPGVSRSMITLTAGLLVGLSMTQALELSLLLGLIIVTGTAAYSLWDALAVIEAAAAWEPLLWGSLLAFFSAILVMRFVLRFLSDYGLMPFAWYRFIVGSSLLILSY